MTSESFQQLLDQGYSIGLSTVRVATPLVFAALGGLLSERSGVVNIALEGLMLVGAIFAAVGAQLFDSPWVGLAFAIAASILLAAMYALSVIQLKADQIVAGTAINFLALGLTPFICKVLYGVSGSTPQLPLTARFQWAPLFLALVSVVLVAWALARTPFGLWIRFAGDSPEGLETAGVKVRKIRWAAVLLSGLFSGLAGASLSIYLASSFSRNMTAGRGFMALAALIFGKWRPLPAAAACLLFALADSLQIRLQGVTILGSEPIPVQFIQILPYLLTVGVLAGLVGRSRAPQSLGVKY